MLAAVQRAAAALRAAGSGLRWCASGAAVGRAAPGQRPWRAKTDRGLVGEAPLLAQSANGAPCPRVRQTSKAPSGTSSTSCEKDSEAVLGVWRLAPLQTSRAPPYRARFGRWRRGRARCVAPGAPANVASAALLGALWPLA